MKALVALLLLVVAGALIHARWRDAAVDWYLIQLRQDPLNPDVHAGLRAIGGAGVPRIAAELLVDENPDRRLTAVVALSLISGPEADAELARAATATDAFVAANAVAAAAGRRDAASALALGRALDDARPQVRLTARRALERRTTVGPWWSFGRSRAAGAAPPAPKEDGRG